MCASMHLRYYFWSAGQPLLLTYNAGYDTEQLAHEYSSSVIYQRELICRVK